MSRERRVEAWVGGIAALGLVLGLAPLLARWSELPDPLATHFTLSGAPDGKMGRSAFALFTAAQPVLVALMALQGVRRSADGSVSAAALRLAIAGFVSGLAASMSWLIVTINVGRGSWTEARMEGLLLALALLFTFIFAGGLGALGRRLWPSKRPLPIRLGEAVALDPGERAYWTGRASSGWYWAVALALSAQAVALHWVLPRTGAIIVGAATLFALALTEHLSQIRVTIDERALTIRYGRLGWLRQRIAMDRIAAATSFELDPWQHGGWGYRGSLRLTRRAAIVVRSGRALRLELLDASQLSVTVDDADTAARLINGFVQRRSSASLTPPSSSGGSLGAPR